MKMKALAIILSATFLSGLCSCGVDKESSTPEATTETGITTEATTQEAIKVGKGDAYNIVTTKAAESQETSESSEATTTTEGKDTSVPQTTEAPRRTDCGYGEITADGALNLVINGYNALKAQDFPTLLSITNFSDICRMEDASLTDTQILQELQSGKYASQLAELSESAGKSEELKKEDFAAPILLTSSEVNEINSTLELLNTYAAQTGSTLNLPHYTQGYKIGFANNTSDIGHLYVLCNDKGEWKYDFCFGIMCEGIAALGNIEDYTSQ